MKHSRKTLRNAILVIGLPMAFLVLIGIYPGETRAGFPFDPRCPGEIKVEPIMDEALEGFARAQSASPEHFIIRVNPFRYSYGRDTMQWLFYRQCAHIELKHDLDMIGKPEGNIPEEIKADCWATRLMTSENKLGYRIIQNIERDLKRMRIWDPSLGPQRTIDLLGCPNEEVIQAPQRLRID